MKHYALLVGINEYPAESGLAALKGAVEDIRLFEDWLATKPVGGVAVVTRRVTVPPDNERASYVPIYDAIEELREDARQAAGSRPFAARLYLYFAGHGLFPRHAGTPGQTLTEAGFFPRDFRSHRATYLPLANIVQELASENYFEEIILFADACRDEPLQRIRPAANMLNIDEDETLTRSRIVLARAARPLERAYEDVFAPSPSHRGVFSKAVMDGLVYAPRNSEGRLTVAGLKDYVAPRMAELRKGKKQQTPEVSFLSEVDSLVLSDQPAVLAQVTLTPPPNVAKIEALEGADVAATVLAGAPAVFPIACGVQAFRVTLDDGQVHTGALKHLDPQGGAYGIELLANGELGFN